MEKYFFNQFIAYYQIFGGTFLFLGAMLTSLDDIVHLIICLIICLLNIFVGISVLSEERFGKVASVVNFIFQIPLLNCFDGFTFDYDLFFQINFIYEWKLMEQVTSIEFMSNFMFVIESCDYLILGMNIFPIILIIGIIRDPIDKNNKPIIGLDDGGGGLD